MSSDHLLQRFSPILLLIVGATAISFAPIFVKLVGSDRLGPTAIGFWRCLIGAAALFLYVLIRGGGVKLPLRLFGFAALAGLIFYGDIYVWHRSIVFAGAGMATILGNTQVQPCKRSSS